MINKEFTKLIGFLGLGSILVACGGNLPKEEPEAIGRVADSLYQSGDTNTSSRLYQQILEMDPTNETAKKNLGKTLRKSREPQEVIQYYRDQLHKTPDSIDLTEELAKAYVNANNGDEAFKLYVKLDKLKPNDPWVTNGLGVSSDLLQKHNDALTYYNKALILAPGNKRIIPNKGLSLALSGKPKEAIVLLLPLADSPQASANVRHNLAIAYALDGQKDKAKAYFAPDIPVKDAEANLKNYAK